MVTIRSLVTLAMMTGAAHAYGVGPPVALETLGKTADLVVKATVVGDSPVIDPWFGKLDGFAPHDTTLAVVAVAKGDVKVGATIHFHHYTSVPSKVGMGYAPQSYELATGGTYLVFAAKGTGGAYRQLDKSHTQKEDQGVILAADTTPRTGATLTALVLAELRAGVASPNVDIAIASIAQLDEMSGGRGVRLADFPRRDVLALISPHVLDSSVPVATAAVTVFGAGSPYFVDADAPYWLAGIGKGTIAGIGPRKPPATPDADVSAADLVTLATRQAAPAALRALAIRALGRSRALSTSTLTSLSTDRDLDVRRAVVLVTAELTDHSSIATAAGSTEAALRAEAALAIGFSQDAALVKHLDRLLKDGTASVVKAAALSILSFAPAVAKPVLTANLGSDFRPLFVNALARADTGAHLAELAEVIEKHLEPHDWWGGMIPAGDSWALLFAYARARPAAELAAGKLDRSLAALEKMQWYSSSEPQRLYALYVVRKLSARAKAFRAAMKHAVGYDMEQYFDLVDKNPDSYLLD